MCKQYLLSKNSWQKCNLHHFLSTQQFPKCLSAYVLFFLHFSCFFRCWRVLIWLFHVFHQADDGAFVAVCNVNITIRDVNNHSPKFERDHYMATIAEDTQIGK